jgi:aspartyl-tRNA(Asn)/glutamyl-tRNA(Gln) amidotransferase subunit C
MKKLTKDQVLHIAKLANLTLTQKEVKKFQQDLTDILDYISVLDELDTKNVKPTSQVMGLKNVFRQDKKGRPLTQKKALANAKNTYKGYFKVANILKEK